MVIFRNYQWGAEKRNTTLWFDNNFVGTELDPGSFGAETLEERVLEMKKKYNIGILSVDDENFGSDIKRKVMNVQRSLKNTEFFGAQKELGLQVLLMKV